MVDVPDEIDAQPGQAPPRFADDVTRSLNQIARSLDDEIDERKRRENRLGHHLYGSRKWTDDERAPLAVHPQVLRYMVNDRGQYVESVERLRRLLERELRRHVLWPWLAPLTGLAGSRTAKVIAEIGDPWRFPGQRCTGAVDDRGRLVRHYFRPVFEPGEPCPVAETRSEIEKPDGGGAAGDGRAEVSVEIEPPVGASCPGVMETPRTHTGVRSVWHYFGLMPGDDGRLVHRRRGIQCTYSPQRQSMVLGSKNGPDGMGNQIKMRRPQPYADVYDREKARKLAGEVETRPESEVTDGLPRWRADRHGQILATKKFVGDLLVEWKRRTEGASETECEGGAALPSPERGRQ